MEKLNEYLENKEKNSSEVKSFINRLLKRKKVSVLENGYPIYTSQTFNRITTIKTEELKPYSYSCCEYIYNSPMFEIGSENRKKFLTSTIPSFTNPSKERDMNWLRKRFSDACIILGIDFKINEVSSSFLKYIRDECIEIYLSLFNENINDVSFKYDGENIIVETDKWLSDKEFKSLVFISRFANRSDKIYLLLSLIIILREKYKKSDLYDLFQMASINILSCSINRNHSGVINKIILENKKRNAIRDLKDYIINRFEYNRHYDFYNTSYTYSSSSPFYLLPSCFQLNNKKEIQEAWRKINDSNHRSSVSSITGFFDSIFIKMSNRGQLNVDKRNEIEMNAFSEFLFYVRKGFHLSALKCLRVEGLSGRKIKYS